MPVEGPKIGLGDAKKIVEGLSKEKVLILRLPYFGGGGACAPLGWAWVDTVVC